MRTDEEIQRDIMAQLRWEPLLNAAKMIAGVRAIANDIQIGISSADEKTDAEIAEEVATALASHRHVEEKKIRVTVDKGIVTLEGSANWNYERRAAAEVIRSLWKSKVTKLSCVGSCKRWRRGTMWNMLPGPRRVWPSLKIN